MNVAGLIFDESLHYLDHLAPFCSLMKWPLIICEDAIGQIAKKYYPDLEIIEQNIFGLKLPSHVVSCYPKPLLQAAFPTQQCKTLWLPHGCSDKGERSPFFEALHEEDLCLVYGQKMRDVLQAKGLDVKTASIGNFRLAYFLQHRSFYEKIFPIEHRYILYAPTWEDTENNGTFFTAFQDLCSFLTPKYRLMVKIHPNTLRKFAVEVEVLKGRYEQNSNLFFVDDFPGIYHLLQYCDAYIGDMSSIGYDFLHFDKPLYFLSEGGRLQVCGQKMGPYFQLHDGKSEARKLMYKYAFDNLNEDSNPSHWL